jgi:O-acetyl-ADP-ribose deacetylase (regulator of RNase III)
MIHVNGDVFQIARAMQSNTNSISTKVAIGHGCNTVGVMGAGFAALVRDRFPTTHRAYTKLCADKCAVVGEVQIVLEDAHNLAVCNLFSQGNPGSNAELWAIQSSVEAALMALKGSGVSLVIPEIGSGIGGLDVEEVRQELYKFSDQLVLVTYK